MVLRRQAVGEQGASDQRRAFSRAGPRLAAGPCPFSCDGAPPAAAGLAGVGDVDRHAHLLPGRGAAVDRQDPALERVAVPEGEQPRDGISDPLFDFEQDVECQDGLSRSGRQKNGHRSENRKDILLSDSVAPDRGRKNLFQRLDCGGLL